MASRHTLLAALAGVLVVVLAVGSAPTKANDGAAKFIEVLGARAVAVLQDNADTTFTDREAAFREILVDGFHIKTISRFVLGRYWRTATDQQRDAYSSVFVDFIVRVYASRFGAGETFEVLTVVEDDSGDSIVRTRLLRPSGGTPIMVDFRVRKFDARYKVIDVLAEGISMLHTFRVEFASVIERKGMDGFIDELMDELFADELPVQNLVQLL